MEFDSLLESPILMTQISRNIEYDQRSVNRKLWRYENGGVDVSLKDGLFSAVAEGGFLCDSPSNLHSNHASEFTEEFSGFLQGSPRNVLPRSATPSPRTTQYMRFRSPCSENFGSSPTTNHNSYRRGMNNVVEGKVRSYSDGENQVRQFNVRSNSQAWLGLARWRLGIF
ncbi:hypothetical protein V6N13_090758 [Hibiscus sabdariffa]|uniref:Uncharacterized protein n=1 Tax=Hibiscus sabdariffa TaxID=183260 RepID=A0ABR2BNS6_9ROSI